MHASRGVRPDDHEHGRGAESPLEAVVDLGCQPRVEPAHRLVARLRPQFPGQVHQPDADVFVAYHDEDPRLGVLTAGRVGRGAEDALDVGVGYRIVGEVAARSLPQDDIEEGGFAHEGISR